MEEDGRKISRSYFTRKLEERLVDRGIEIAQSLYILMDTPFDDFSEEDREAYDSRFRALTHVFLEALREVYISMGAPYQGWDERSERLEPTPVKILARLVLMEEERLQAMADEAVARLEGGAAGTGPPGGGQGHWWNRKTTDKGA